MVQNMKRMKQLSFTAAGIIFIVLLFLLAMYFPKYLNAFFDQKTLNRVTQRNLSLKTYELTYDSFYEKLYAIARCNKEELHVVPVQNRGMRQEKEKLTRIVQKELNLLSEEGNIMLDDVKLKTANFSSCETFTLYSSSDTERLKGITYWKIIYRKKRETFILYMDEEYHKIYAIKVIRKESNISCPPLGQIPEYEKQGDQQLGYQKSVDAFSVFHTLAGYYTDFLLRYYALDKNEFYPLDIMDSGYGGDILFQDGSALRLECQWETKIRKKNNYITMFLGINLEQMLQF